jgi:hypothetical protein
VTTSFKTGVGTKRRGGPCSMRVSSADDARSSRSTKRLSACWRSSSLEEFYRALIELAAEWRERGLESEIVGSLIARLTVLASPKVSSIPTKPS